MVHRSTLTIGKRASYGGVARYEDDPWLQSPERLPLSGQSLEVLFSYGPVVFGSRCFNPEEYNASVRQFMERNPRISRALAEQEIHEFLFDGTACNCFHRALHGGPSHLRLDDTWLGSRVCSVDLARTTAKGYKGPDEVDLKPAAGLVDKLLVVAWVAILIPAVNYIVTLSLTTPVTKPLNPF